MPVPRLPVALVATPPVVAARHRPRVRRWRWVDVKEAADRAGVCQKTMYRHCAAGVVHARLLGGAWRVRLDEYGFPAAPPAAGAVAP
jgi:helix-turn-helix protein